VRFISDAAPATKELIAERFKVSKAPVTDPLNDARERNGCAAGFTRFREDVSFLNGGEFP